MARLTGLEPATPGVTGRYSNQLSYNRPLLGCTRWCDREPSHMALCRARQAMEWNFFRSREIPPSPRQRSDPQTGLIGAAPQPYTNPLQPGPSNGLCRKSAAIPDLCHNPIRCPNVPSGQNTDFPLIVFDCHNFALFPQINLLLTLEKQRPCMAQNRFPFCV